MFAKEGKIRYDKTIVFILVFFTVYASSCFVTCGKLFSTLFGLPYHSMMIVGAAFVIFIR